jgi:hypothetical protein
MQRIKDWKKLERHELSSEYADWPSDQRESVIEKMRTRNKWTVGFITIHDGKVLDGWQRLQCAIAANIHPHFRQLGKKEDPDEYVAMMNDDRRHESQSIIMERAAKRRERVAEKLRAGKSERVIAKEEKVSPKTIHEDKKALTATGVAVDPPEGKVHSADGKDRPALQPKSSVFCDRCTRIGSPIKGCEACKEKRGKAKSGKPTKPPKSGTQKTSFKSFEKDFGPIARFPESVVKEYPTERMGAYYHRLVNLLNDVANCVRDWKAAIAKGKVA